MNSLYFWKNWPRQEKLFYWFLFISLSISVLLYLFSWLGEAGHFIQWTTQSEISPVEAFYHYLGEGPINLPLTSNFYLIKTKFVGTDILYKDWPIICLFIVVMAGLAVLLGMASTLSRFSYIVAMGIFVLLGNFMNLSEIQLFDSPENYTLIVLIVFTLPLSYGIHAFGTAWSLTGRIAVFFLALALFVITIVVFGQERNNLLALATNSSQIPLIFFVLFCIAVGNEIPVFLLIRIDKAFTGNKKQVLFHFFLISFIYLIILVLTFLYNRRYSDQPLVVVNAFVLLVPLVLLGLWGFRRKEPTYDNVAEFRPMGAYYYAVLAIIGMAYASFVFISDNDALIEVLEDSVIFTQIGFTASFIIYVFVNFIILMVKGHAVEKILFDPKQMPYFTQRLVGLVIVLALFLSTNMHPFSQSLSGYHVAKADYYRMIGNMGTAQLNYNFAANYEPRGHRVNYTMSRLAKLDNNREEEVNYLTGAISKNPSPQSFANLSSAYSVRSSDFQKAVSLEQGLNHFPEAGQLMNNLGLLVSNSNHIDSAAMYFNNAELKKSDAGIPSSNLIGLFSEKNQFQFADSILTLSNPGTDYKLWANLMAYSAQSNADLDVNDMPEVDFATTENKDKLVYLYNQLLKGIKYPDSVFINALQRHVLNDKWLSEPLEYATALGAYKSGSKSTTFNVFNASISEFDFEKKYIAASLAYDSKEYLLAQDYLINNLGYNKSVVALLTNLGAKDWDKAKYVMNSFQPTDNEKLNPELVKAANMLDLDMDMKDLLASTDLTKYLAIRFLPQFDSLHDLSVIKSTVMNKEVLAAIILLELEKNIDQNNEKGIIENIEALDQLQFYNAKNVMKYNRLMAEYLFSQLDIVNLNDLLQSESFGNDRKYRSYMIAKSNSLSPDFIIDETEYSWLAFNDPFFVKGVTIAADWYEEQGSIQQAYDILVSAVSINKYNPDLNEAYIISCLKMGLNQYAEESLKDYSYFAEPTRFREFTNRYDQIKSESDDAGWH